MDSPFEPTFAVAGHALPDSFRAEFLVGPQSPFRVTLVGSMQLWRRHPWLSPVYWLLSRAGVMVAITGRDIPTTLTVEPGRDAHGAPFHILHRVFSAATPAHFDTLTTYDATRRCLVDHIGPRRSLLLFWHARFIPSSSSPAAPTADSNAAAGSSPAAPAEDSATAAPTSSPASPDSSPATPAAASAPTPPAELRLIPLGFALALGPLELALPSWLAPLLVGTPRFRQRITSTHPLDDSLGAIHVEFAISHPLLGDLFGYHGTFRVLCTPDHSNVSANA